MKKHDMSFLKYILLMISILLILLGVALISMHNQNKKYFRTTDAVIVDIVTDVNVDVYDDEVYSDSEHYVYVDYVVDGVKYENVLLDRYDISMYIGKVISVNYDIRNPLKLGGKNTFLVFSIVSIGSGVVMGGISLTRIIKRKK